MYSLLAIFCISVLLQNFIKSSHHLDVLAASTACFFLSYASVDESKSRKFKGSLILPEVSPNTVIESNIQFKKSIPASMDKIMSEASTLLQNLVSEKMKEFETEFKAL